MSTAVRSGPALVARDAGTVPAFDPVEIFVRARGAFDAAWLWLPPEGPPQLAFGVAAGIAGGGSTLHLADGAGRIVATSHCGDRFAAAEELRLGLGSITVPGDPEPLLVGGFAFAPAGARTPAWRGFGPVTLFVPSLEIMRVAGALAVRTRILDWGGGTHPGRDLERLQARLAVPAASVLQPGRVVTGNRPDDSAWCELVARAVERIGAGELAKLVLARTLTLEADRPFDLARTLRRLRIANPTSAVFALSRGSSVFLGATPELLLRTAGATVESVPLAGTAPAGRRLDDVKSVHEHGLLAQDVTRRLAGLCEHLEADPAPRPHTYGPVVHLGTHIRGRLRGPPAAAFTLLRRLHPTPAVGALPRAAAAGLSAIEGFDRGMYAGPIGWAGATHAEFRIALRCALVHGACATLYAGAGIVAGSRPDDELAETELKFATMREALA